MKRCLCSSGDKSLRWLAGGAPFAQPVRRSSSSAYSSFASRFPTIADTLQPAHDSKPLSVARTPRSVSVRGWVRTARTQKSVAFLHVTDGSNVKGLQAVFEDPSLTKGILTGAYVEMEGVLVKSPASEQEYELKVSSIRVPGPSDAQYPMAKKWHPVEHVREHPHLRSRTLASGCVFRIRSAIVHAIHDFFASQKFHQVHTPIMTSSDCEGGGEVFSISTPGDGRAQPLPDPQTSSSGTLSSPQSLPSAAGISSASSLAALAAANNQYFGHPAFLTVSGQLHLEAMSQGLSRAYTLSPCFRAEHSSTSRHLAEFWMLEAEAVFPPHLPALLDLAEEMLKSVATRVLQDCSADLDFLKSVNKRPSGVLELAGVGAEAADGESNLSRVGPSRFARITYTDAIQALQSVKGDATAEWGRPLSTEQERWLAEHWARGPVFVTRYPASIKPFYMRVASDDSGNESRPVVECSDLLVPGVGELMGGSLREERIDVYQRRIAELGMDKDSSALKWYEELRRWGSAPHGGYGIGLERLVMYITGSEHVRDVIPFPRAYKSCFA